MIVACRALRARVAVVRAVKPPRKSEIVRDTKSGPPSQPAQAVYRGSQLCLPPGGREPRGRGAALGRPPPRPPCYQLKAGNRSRAEGDSRTDRHRARGRQLRCYLEAIGRRGDLPASGTPRPEG